MRRKSQMDITKENGNGATNVSEETEEEVEQLTIRIRLKKGQRFTSVEFIEKTGLNVLLKNDERRRQRIANDFIAMLIRWNVIKPMGERTVEGGWTPILQDTKKRGRKLMVYEVIADFFWSLEKGDL
jgi:hypothetical protein